jgi:hypothetical protein
MLVDQFLMVSRFRALALCHAFLRHILPPFGPFNHDTVYSHSHSDVAASLRRREETASALREDMAGELYESQGSGGIERMA